MASDAKSLDALNHAISKSRPFVTGGTKAVLGEGPLHPDLALVGEQPGDQEDRQGRPFVGPAGKLLDRALTQAGIDRDDVYITNAVKHFKYELRGKRRLHSKPNAGEIKHYRRWLKTEMELVKPRVVVALGASAALALAGKVLTISANRGRADFEGQCGFITIHPSSLLRIREEKDRHAAFRKFVSDLKKAKALAAGAHRAA